MSIRLKEVSFGCMSCGSSFSSIRHSSGSSSSVSARAGPPLTLDRLEPDLRAEAADSSSLDEVDTSSSARVRLAPELTLTDRSETGVEARLVLALSLFKIRAFLDGPKRLRTACDLDLASDAPRRARPDGFTLPDRATLAGWVQDAIGACVAEGLLADPPVTEVTFASKKSKKKKGG